MTTPKHRANKTVRTEPRVQPAPKHRGPSDLAELQRPTERQAFVELSISDLMQDVFTGNPYRPTGVGRHRR